jgi:hypothetical protein
LLQRVDRRLDVIQRPIGTWQRSTRIAGISPRPIGRETLVVETIRFTSPAALGKRDDPTFLHEEVSDLRARTGRRKQVWIGSATSRPMVERRAREKVRRRMVFDHDFKTDWLASLQKRCIEKLTRCRPGDVGFRKHQFGKCDPG